MTDTPATETPATTTAAETAYLALVRRVLDTGVRKPNRTGTDTLSVFGEHYAVDLAGGFPLLTTKRVAFASMLRETLWYLSGADHIRDLRRHTKIWDAWATEDGDLETAYGRFWRRFPVPAPGAALGGEAWADAAHPNVHREADGSLSFDQLGYVVDMLRRDPASRRLVVSAWHPANAAVSRLPPCFAPDTLVRTPNGYKPISEIREGEDVVSGSGEVRRVRRVWETDYEGPRMSIRVRYNSAPILCTPNHPFLVRERGWVEAGEIRPGDFVAVHRNRNQEVPTLTFDRYLSTGMRREHVDLTPADFYSLGYFLGDGWVSQTGPLCSFSVSKRQEAEVLPRLRQSIKVSAKPNSGRNVTTFETRSAKWVPTLREFGHRAHGKRIPQWVHDAPDKHVEAFLEGYEDADGCRPTRHPGRIQYTTTSPHVAYGVQALYAKLGRVAGVYHQKRPDTCVIEGRTVRQRDTYTVYVQRRSYHCSLDDTHLWIKVGAVSKTEESESGKVYNLDVAIDHTYNVGNFVTHNCHYTFCFNVSPEPPAEAGGDGGPDRLHCHLTQRSADLALGVPFNLACYALLTQVVAGLVGLRPGRFAHSLVDAHVYVDHIDGLEEQLTRTPTPAPTLRIAPHADGRPKGLGELSVDDFELVGYAPQPAIRFPVAV